MERREGKKGEGKRGRGRENLLHEAEGIDTTTDSGGGRGGRGTFPLKYIIIGLHFCPSRKMKKIKINKNAR